MTPDQFSDALSALGWSDSDAADVLDVRHDTIGKWRRGKLAIPAPIATWIATAAATWPAIEVRAWDAYVAAHPLPRKPESVARDVS